MAPKPVSSDKQIPAAADDPVAPELRKKLPADTDAPRRAIGDKPAASLPPDDEDEADDALEIDDDEDDEDLVVFTAKEAAGALATVYAFVQPYLKNYKKMLTFVSIGVVVETLFNVIMPLSLKFLIDDALGEEDFQALYTILGVLAAAGIFTSIVAVWYERRDARLAACVITDVRNRLFEHVQNLPSAYFARTKRGEILSRFSIDLSAFEGSIKSFVNSAALPFFELIAGILLVLAIGAYLATKGQITIGTFVTFESAFWEVSYNIAHIMHFIPVSIQSAAAVRHIQELLDEPTRGADRPGAPDLPRITNDITFDRVTFQYENSQTPVLDNFSLKLKVGKTIAVVGPSGSGKSTLLNLILRLYVPDDGQVTINGVDIRKVTRESLRKSMAVVFQENMLFNMSIRENIRLGKEGATDEEVEQAARKAENHRYILSLPPQYETAVGERGGTPSGGQRQRIAIARAIFRNPSVLLLDEATSALDQTTEAAINKTLLKLARGRTMIFSTHRLTSVVDMDEIIVISGGRAIERGSHQELLAANGVYRRLWDDQSHTPHAEPDKPGDTSDDDDEDDED